MTTTKGADMTAATRFETTRHASKAAHDDARKTVASAEAFDRDEARRMFKREARRARDRFDNATDETVRTYEAVYASRMQAEAEARS